MSDEVSKVEGEITKVGDAAEGEVTQVAQEATQEAQGAVIEAEHAMVTVKAKMGVLHALIANVGHYATLPITEVEALMAEVNYLLGIVRAKL